eukprot:GDKI01000314.1.p2 GENE.GDKI01000314.1~~GDKI01000314.1.p2  ORF type:complete len:110 (-),score=14.31 GDKI01000314.1:41-370(-)
MYRTGEKTCQHVRACGCVCVGDSVSVVFCVFLACTLTLCNLCVHVIYIFFVGIHPCNVRTRVRVRVPKSSWFFWGLQQAAIPVSGCSLRVCYPLSPNDACSSDALSMHP